LILFVIPKKPKNLRLPLFDDIFRLWLMPINVSGSDRKNSLTLRK
jgi:hypothetical protein